MNPYDHHSISSSSSSFSSESSDDEALLLMTAQTNLAISIYLANQLQDQHKKRKNKGGGGPKRRSRAAIHRLRAEADEKIIRNVQVEELPPALDSTSEPPSVFDGTTRLYISYMCPYAQRVWITRNCKGLQEKIKLVAIDLPNRPDWYKEKVYPANKVPALEHNNEVIGESLDLIRYLDTNFEGPVLLPNDPAKREFAEELLSYTSEFSSGVVGSIKGDANVGAPFDYLEAALSKFSDGPFFLGEFSLVDIAYAPFVERYQPLVLDVKKYDITSGRPKLASWIEELNKIDGYRQTKRDPAELVASLKKRILGI
ncbi:hypothetical protein C5167_000728 [Papaver somniferum]|uniref:GST N-terminal domain-containing protein n=1 Tax=Papaver somniferum TaxID=3469 RepID=A0A4Y7KUQ4_PAPSO|nr:hypothetical protein C5167_000728 [Papaver somniferum]